MRIKNKNKDCNHGVMMSEFGELGSVYTVRYLPYGNAVEFKRIFLLLFLCTFPIYPM